MIRISNVSRISRAQQISDDFRIRLCLGRKCVKFWYSRFRVVQPSTGFANFVVVCGNFIWSIYHNKKLIDSEREKPSNHIVNGQTPCEYSPSLHYRFKNCCNWTGTTGSQFRRCTATRSMSASSCCIEARKMVPGLFSNLKVKQKQQQDKT